MNFDRDVRVEAAYAKQDRIQIDIGRWLFDGLDVEFDQFANLIADRDWASIDGSDIELHPLNRPQGFQGNKYVIRFASRRQGGKLRADAPLVEGNLILHRYRATQFGPSRFDIIAEISLNPTRALVHQPRNSSIINDYLGRTENEATIPPPELLTKDLPEPIRNERLIDPLQDNVIIDRPWLIMARPPHWQHFRNYYLAQIHRFLDDLIGGTFRQGEITGQIGFRWDINLKQIETYWEFMTPDPIHMMRQVEPIFMAMGRDARHRLYKAVVSDYVVDGNVPVLTTRLRTGLKATLYPKTTRRLRLETRHDLQKRDIGTGGHTFDDPTSAILDAATKIDEVAEDAATEVNRLLERLTEALPPFPPPEPPYKLVKEILWATENEEDQDLLLSVLINNGSYRCLAGDSLRPAIDQLVRRNVLIRTRPYSQTFILTAPYHEARRILEALPEQNES
ncbi:MAG: hypothetical protein OIF58_09525 [Cohaesibacter sp.]|nr:hypothetical protein [Cohaesibacter sp.]